MIDNLSSVGIGASIIHSIRIGKNVVVAADAVVDKDIQENVMVAGVSTTIKKQLEVVGHGA